MSKICELFGVTDEDYIPKRRLLKAVAALHDDLMATRIELFCENPDHRYFKGLPESSLAPLRTLRVLRFEERNKACQKELLHR